MCMKRAWVVGQEVGGWADDGVGVGGKVKESVRRGCLPCHFADRGGVAVLRGEVSGRRGVEGREMARTIACEILTR